ncbi:MAG: PEP-CTERM sorting domain-containing protein [Phycisphaerales bacterium]|jgi:hypothetical protein
MATLGLPRVVVSMGVLGACVHACVGQVIDATWIDDTSGTWSDAARWSSPDFPTARGPDLYRAIIEFDSGGAYTISLGAAIDLDSLRFTSTDATIDGGGTGTIVVRTELEFGDGTARAISELMSEGTLLFTGDLVAEIDDTPLCHVGSVGRKTGTGDILLTGTTVFEIMDGSSFTIESSGDFGGDGTARIINDGVFAKQSAGLTLIEDVGFVNTGTVVVEDGTLEITNPILPSAGTLGPATYDIFDAATLDLSGTTLDTNQADVIFRGPDSAFPQFSAVETNQGLARAEGGADISFSPTSGLANEGVLEADGVGSTITATGSLTNTGQITVFNGGIVRSATVENNLGVVEGNGTIQAALFTNNGLVSPGNSPGVLVTENPTGTHFFQQGFDGTLLIEIEGRTPGIDHDVLEIRGGAFLDGVLQLEFSPFSGEPPVQPGDQFEIILADSLDGQFRDIELRGLGLEGDVDVLFTPGGVVIVVQQVPAPGALVLLGLGGMMAGRRRR